MVLPAPKYFHLSQGVTFDYTFQYLSGTPTSSSPINLTGFTAVWAVNYNGGTTNYTTGQSSGHSGVFFGGQAGTPTNGIIDLVIAATDTADLPWEVATYTFRVTDPLNNVYQLLVGGMGIIF